MVRRCLTCGSLGGRTVKLKQCSSCKKVYYCSRGCQKKSWKWHKHCCKAIQQGFDWGEIPVIPSICEFLDLKEKVAVSSLNKLWRKGATSSDQVTIDPSEIGLNIDGALAFVSSKFRNLENVTVRIDQDYFLEMNGKKMVQLRGSALNCFFRNCNDLKSAYIVFGSCCETPLQRILSVEHGLDSLRLHTSLQSLTLMDAHFFEPRQLSDIIRPLVNLRALHLFGMSFGPAFGLIRGALPDDFIDVINNMTKLRKLQLRDHGLTDSQILRLRPVVMKELRNLNLEGQFGDVGRDTSLTDATMSFVSESCPKLQVLEISYNLHISSEAIMEVARSCPLRELAAHETGLETSHLKSLVTVCPTLMLVRYGRGYGTTSQFEENHLREAATASGGRTIFFGASIYKPTFDDSFMREYSRTYNRIDKCNTCNESNGWNEWEDLLEA